jgi:hypothetical protein
VGKINSIAPLGLKKEEERAFFPGAAVIHNKNCGMGGGNGL